MSNEHRAKDEAYQEYLRLRESSNSRGNYVKDDTLYGSYFPSGGKKQSSEAGNGIENTPYGESELRRRQQEIERQRYLEERAREAEKNSKKNKRKGKPIAMQGRRNKADEDKPRNRKLVLGGGKNGGGKNGGGNGSSRKMKTATVVLLALVIGIGAIIGTSLVVVKETLNKVGRIEIDPAMLGIDPQVDQELSNYRNIALLGIDARDMSDDSNVRSDAIIVASINKETGEIKMFSVYRDTMLDLGEEVGLDKITHAYYYGGPTKVLYTLNTNLDLNIKEVVIVNWKSVADTVDALGGLEIEILDSEIDELNRITEHTYNTIGGSDEMITEPGVQTLNGNQAVAYARIRKDAVTGDYRRNERMKIVVKAAFDEAKSIDPGAIKKISNDILPQIKTNMTTSDMMGMVLDLASYNMTDSEGFPYNVSDYNEGVYYGVPVTLQSNVVQLHEQFFAQGEYVPTQHVQDVSNNIAYTTGYY